MDLDIYKYNKNGGRKGGRTEASHIAYIESLGRLVYLRYDGTYAFGPRVRDYLGICP